MVLDNSARATAAIRILLVVAASCAVNMLVNVQFLHEYGNLTKQQPTLSADSIPQLLGSMVAVLRMVLLIFMFVYLIRWYRRAYANIARAGGQTAHTDGWAAAYWFIPFANFWYPYAMFKEIWQKTQRIAHGATEPHGWLRLWGLAFTGWVLLGRVYSTTYTRVATLADLYDCAQLEMGVDLLLLLFCLLTVFIIRQLRPDEAALLEVKGRW